VTRARSNELRYLRAMHPTRRVFQTGLTAAALLGAGPARASEFEAATHVGADGVAMPYRLLRPANPGARPPVILWLSGSGGRGSDNARQISGGNSGGARLWGERAIVTMQPSIVLAPQCPSSGAWTREDDRVTPTRHLHRAVELLLSVIAAEGADPARVYAVGQSMGGFAAWALPLAYPGLFAAIMPVCGGGDVREASKLMDLPIWAFHGARDATVPVERTRDMIEAVRWAGGRPRYTEYPDVGHAAWTPAFQEPRLPAWLFAQHL